MTFNAQAALMHAINECHECGEFVTVFDPFEEGEPRLVGVPIIAIDAPALKFQVKRVGDDMGKWFSIGHILGIKRASGKIHPSQSGLAYWKEIKARRAAQAAWTNSLTDITSFPDYTLSPHGARLEVVGESHRIPGPPGAGRDVELVTVRGKVDGSTNIEVENRYSAVRVCSLVGEGYWSTAHTWLACEFTWTSWMRENPMGTLVPQATITKVFRWARTLPAEVVNLFIAKSWEYHRVFLPNVNQLTEPDARLLIQKGLCCEAKAAPLDVLLQSAHFNDMRAILKTRGRKTMNKENAVAQLKELLVVEAETVHAELRASPGFIPKFCLMPPVGLSWSEWQNVRTWHSAMVFAFSEFR